MGFYLNHPSDTDDHKMVIINDLIENGAKIITRDEFLHYQPKQGEVLLCLIDNGTFSALAVIVDERERQAVGHISDRRRQAFMFASISAIKPYNKNIEKYITLGQ